MFTDNLPLIMFCWMLVVLVMAIVRRRKAVVGVGLVLSYLLNFWIIFWAGSIPYLMPWFRGPLKNVTTIGTEYSLYAVLAFAFGSLALTPWLLDSGILPRAREIKIPDARLPRAYLTAGIASYGLLSVFLGRVLSLNAILSSGQSLVVVGLALCSWQAWRNGEYRKLVFWTAMAFLPPLLTVITRGYLSSGMFATIAVLLFLANFAESRSKVFAGALIVGYLGLSLFVTYMRDRGDIRRSVWGGADYSTRFDQLGQIFTKFEWFDPTSQEHLERIDSRMNQSFLVGAAVTHLQETGGFVHGETLIDSFFALIPRIIWPEKPISAGSGNLVSRFTGMHFDKTTSVGIGQITEFYANFGTPGLVIGMMIFGLIITTLDVLATERLAVGDLHGFVLWYLPGLAFMQVGGQLVEITASAAASLFVALVVNRFLDRMQRTQSVSVPSDGSALAQYP